MLDFKKQNQFNDISIMAAELNIFRSKHIQRSGDTWRTVEKYLTNKKIWSHVTGLAIFGYFLNYATDIFAFDIDNHIQGRELYSNIGLLTKYNYLVKQFGRPSIVFRSSDSKGLHCYYKLQEKYPFIVIQQAVLNQIRKLPAGIDFRPSPDAGIRLPFAKKEGGLLLDSETLKPINDIDYSGMIEKLVATKRRHFVEIFNSNPSAFILKHKSKKAQYKNYKALKKFELLEADIFPIVEGEGNRNEKLERLAFAYHCAGMDAQEGTQRILRHITGIGRDYQQHRIEKQLECHYKRYEKRSGELKAESTKANIKRADRQLDLFLQNKINRFVKASPFSTKRQAGFRRFMIELYNWTDYIKSMSNQDRVYYNFLYPYFWHNTKRRSLIPLPQNLMQGWNKRHNEIIDYLKESGTIELRQNYSTDLGVCNYYYINQL